MGVVVLQNCSSSGVDNTPEVFKDVVNNTKSFSVTSNDLKGLKALNDYSFYNSKLSSIEIPSTVNSISGQSLLGCDDLESITGSTSAYTIVDNGIGTERTFGVFYLRKGCKNTIIPSDLATFLSENAFGNLKSLKYVKIPDDARVNLYQSPYRGCINMTYIQGSSKVVSCILPEASITNCKLSLLDTTIESGRFDGLSGFTNIEFPNGVTSIGDYAFSATDLIELTLVDNPTIGAQAFSYCSNLNYVEMTTYNGRSVNSSAFSNSPIKEAKIHGNFLSAIPTASLERLELTGGTLISGYKFSNASTLKSLTLSNTITNIETYAFVGCTNLSYLNFNGTADEWCSISFRDENSNPLKYAHKLHLYGASISKLIISGRVSVLNAYSFLGGDFKSVHLPNTLTTIGASCFNGCTSLTDIYYDGTMTDWSSVIKGTNWDYGTNPYTIHCTDGDI